MLGARTGTDLAPSQEGRSHMANFDAQHLHHQVLEVLLEKVEQDTYPSVTMLDMIESLLQPEDVQQYADVLLDKIRADDYPSIDLLRRLQTFA